MEVSRKNVLASLGHVPQRRMIDVSKLPCNLVAQGMKKSKDTLGSKDPEQEAIQFYVLNHLVAYLQTIYTPHELLAKDDGELVGEYVRVLAAQARRMYTYLHLIITREARHAHALGDGFLNKFANHTLSTFFKTIASNPSESAAIARFIDHPPSASIGQYTQMIRDGFYELSWSPGFGGKAWGNIADCTLRFVKGESSAEIMVDTAYTLAHNNGPIFNKGMVYGSYDKKHILEILDVQRSGQMPEYVLEGPCITIYPGLKDLVQSFKVRHPAAFGVYVDWYKVEELGAIGTYPAKKAAQASKHGKTVTVPGALGKQQHETGTFYVDPKLTLPIVSRKKAA